MCGLPEGPDDVGHVVAFIQGAELLRRPPDGLHYEGDRAARGVGGGDGQGDALALLAYTDDHEMPRLARTRDERGFDFELHHMG